MSLKPNDTTPFLTVQNAAVHELFKSRFGQAALKRVLQGGAITIARIRQKFVLHPVTHPLVHAIKRPLVKAFNDAFAFAAQQIGGDVGLVAVNPAAV